MGAFELCFPSHNATSRAEIRILEALIGRTNHKVKAVTVSRCIAYEWGKPSMTDRQFAGMK